MLKMQLLGGFGLFGDGVSIDVPPSSARVLAFLGLHGTYVSRSSLAANLWPEADTRRGLGNLRSSVWRLPRAARSALRTRGGELAISEEVECDVHRIEQEASRRSPQLLPPEPSGICAELLPGWYDDWILIERERLAMYRAELFERLSRQCHDEGRPTEAALYALASISVEPLRESAHQALLLAHVAQGNEAELLSHYATLTTLLREALGVVPSEETTAIVRNSRRQSCDARPDMLPPWPQ